MPKRSFVRKNGKPQIKEESEAQDVYRTVSSESKIGYIHMADLNAFSDFKTCAFLRPYIPGEFAGFPLPKNLDLSEITMVYVILYGVETHILKHLKPLGDTYKVVVHDVDYGTITNVRVPLLPEQAEVIQKEIEK